MILRTATLLSINFIHLSVFFLLEIRQLIQNSYQIHWWSGETGVVVTLRFILI